MTMNNKTKKNKDSSKNTRQGSSRNTKHSATSSNKATPKYRGQGR